MLKRRNQPGLVNELLQSGDKSAAVKAQRNHDRRLSIRHRHRCINEPDDGVYFLTREQEAEAKEADRLAEIKDLRSEIEDREAELKDLRAQLAELMAG